MKSRPLLPLFAAALVVAAPLLRAADPAKPNIVFILADDLGWGDLASYGHPYMKTPALDRFAREGTAFRQYYVTGCTCNPSRTGLMTGQLPARFQKYPADHGFGGAMTITEILAKNGYQLGHFGKWHMGPVEASGTYGIGTVTITGDASDPRGRDSQIADNTIAFMRQHRDVPFYVNVWCHSTHYQVDPPEPFVAEFASLKVNYEDFPPQMREHFDRYREIGGNVDDAMRRYCAEVLALDRQIGRILRSIDELGLRENTLVVFSSDNGPGECENKGGWRLKKQGRIKLNMVGSPGALRGRKHTFYEGGVREPFIVRWPGHVPAGRVDTESVLSGADWLPTLCRLTNVPLPAARLDGEDVSDLWLGQVRARRTPLMWKRSVPRSELAIRDGDWKLWVEHGASSRLYDLREDPAETIDVAAAHPAVVKRLAERVEAWNRTLPKSYEKSPGKEELE